MTEVLVSPDVIQAATGFLRSYLGVLADRVGTEVPETMPANMVRVSLTGGARRDIVTDAAQLTVECWAPNEPTASLLARTAHGLMHSAAGTQAGGIWVRRVETVGGVQSFPDPDTAKPRYQFTVRWHVRSAAI